MAACSVSAATVFASLPPFNSLKKSELHSFSLLPHPKPLLTPQYLTARFLAAPHVLSSEEQVLNSSPEQVESSITPDSKPIGTASDSWQDSQDTEDEVLEAFFRDRELNGDFITRASDIFFPREGKKSGILQVSSTQPGQEASLDESEGGFLKLSRTQEWVSGETTAPFNKKLTKMELQDDRERRKRLNILKYEALKKELLLLTVAIGVACSGYCLITLSVQAAVSYAAGVLFSCLYLLLLYQHADNISKDSVPQIFMRKKSKKIGIRSEDLKDFFVRSVKGSSIALSSPRLVIPATIYGLWILSHQHPDNFFDFQIVPAMIGMFAYKAASLVQVYRDNEDLQFVFPEDE